MKKRFKRLFALFLCLALSMTTLCQSVGAGTVVTPGSGATLNNTSTQTNATDFWVNTYGYTGLAIGLQVLGSDYAVSYEDEMESDPNHMAEGMAKAVLHFLTNYPDVIYHTDSNCSCEGQCKYYILPNNSWYKDGNREFKYNGSQIGYDTMNTNYYGLTNNPGYVEDNLIGQVIWDAAEKNKTEATPYVHVDSGYFTGKLAQFSNGGYYTGINRAYVRDTMLQLFGHRENTNGTGTSDVLAINDEINVFLQMGLDKFEPDTADYDARKLCNYAGLLCTVAIAALPSCMYSTIEQYLNDFLYNALKGEPYNPIVITAETVIAHSAKESDSQADVWRTMAEGMAAQSQSDITAYTQNGDYDWKSAAAAVTENSRGDTQLIRDMIENTNTAAYIGSVNSQAEINNGLYKLYAAKLKENGAKQVGQTCNIGAAFNKSSKKLVAYTSMTPWGIGMKSVSDGVITQAATRLGIAEKVKASGLYGFGVFGLDSSLVIENPPPPPVSTAGSGVIQPAGDLTVNVDPTYVMVEDESYALDNQVTVTLDLNQVRGDYKYTTTVGGVTTTTDASEMQDVIGVLKWMKSVNMPVYDASTGGYAFLVKLWIKASNPIQHQDDSYYNTLNSRKDPVSNSADLEGGKLTWSSITQKFVLKGAPTEAESGIKITLPANVDDPLVLQVTDFDKAIKYLEANAGVLTLVSTSDLTMTGEIPDPDVMWDHYFKVGAAVRMMGMKSLDDTTTYVPIGAGCFTSKKYARLVVAREPIEEHFVSYYSSELPSYAEFKQGTVNTSGGTTTEKFNSMTGTPTNTNGKYYQYFAAGGTEFIVEFDAEWVEESSSTRTYTATYSAVPCDKDKSVPCAPCAGHQVANGTDADGNTKYKTEYYNGDHCACNDIHQACKTHTVSDTFTWTQSVSGFSYMKITNLKVWKLSAAKLDGTRELLDTDEVTASVLATAPAVFYNVAGADNATSGRLVYTYQPTSKDKVSYSYTSNNSCTNHKQENQTHLDGATAGITNGATCISDFIVLRTSNGDQSILYYEYEANGAVSINTGNCVAEPIEFENQEFDTMWTNNPYTSEASGLPADGITYGGYTGDYASTTKYKSFGHPSNIDVSSTTAGKNASGAFKVPAKPSSVFRLMASNISIPDTKKNGEYELGYAYVFYEKVVDAGSNKKPNMHEATAQVMFNNKVGFVVAAPYSPTHTKINDVVVFNPVSVQYTGLIELPASRDQRTGDLGDLENYTPTITALCPGDSTCIYSHLDCNRTDHLHDEDCFAYTKAIYHEKVYTTHSHSDSCYQYTVHSHLDSCPYSYTSHSHTTSCPTTFTYHNHTSACDYDLEEYEYGVYECACGRSTSGAAGGISTIYHTVSGNRCYYGWMYDDWDYDYVYYCGNLPLNAGGSYTCNNLPLNSGKTYSCGNLPLNSSPALKCNNLPLNANQSLNNAHDCSLVPSTTESGYEYDVWFDDYLSTVESFYLPAGAVIKFWSTYHSEGDPYGYITGTVSASNDDGNGDLDFYVEATTTREGWVYLEIGSYSDNYGYADVRWSITYGGCTPHTSHTHNSSCPGTGPTSHTHTSSCNYTITTYACFYAANGLTCPLTNCPGYHAGAIYHCNNLPLNTGGSYSCGNLPLNTGGTCTGEYNTHRCSGACYEYMTSILTCTDTHHAVSYNWKLYTKGMEHTSGNDCTGRNCTDTTPLKLMDNSTATVTQMSQGYIVKHTNGNVHLSLNQTTCTYCNKSISSVLSTAQSTDRTPAATEWTHGPAGSSCYVACFNNDNHRKVTTEVKDETGANVQLGTFVQLDYGFTLYFPNRGDFYGTGAKATAETSGTLGWGYTDNMDTTPWTKYKWVSFPFYVNFNGETYSPNERIYLPVNQTYYDFYVPMSNVEMSMAKISYGVIANNTQRGTLMDCGSTEYANNLDTYTSQGKKYVRNHSAQTFQRVDVIGRIGALTIQDTGDFRFSNLFKVTLSTWYVKNVVKNVNISLQNAFLTDPVDIRGEAISMSKGNFDTFGTQPSRSKAYGATLMSLPLTPSKNNIAALQKQPLRLGYEVFLDFSTIGNYYGENVEGESDYKAQVTPLYWSVDINTGVWTPVDVYSYRDGNYVLINRFNDFTSSAPASYPVSLNWTEEAIRRNYSGAEAENTKLVAEAFGVDIPSGSNYTYGTAMRMFLKDRNRTFIGSNYTNGTDINVSNELNNLMFARQAQRWHFSIELPSSAVFVATGKTVNSTNISAVCNNNSVIVCALDIKVAGTVWTMEYDGSSINKPFTVVNGTATIDPVRGPGTNLPGKRPVVAVFASNKSSRDDLTTSGTH